MVHKCGHLVYQNFYYTQYIFDSRMTWSVIHGVFFSKSRCYRCYLLTVLPKIHATQDCISFL